MAEELVMWLSISVADVLSMPAIKEMASRFQVIDTDSRHVPEELLAKGKGKKRIKIEKASYSGNAVLLACKGKS